MAPPGRDASAASVDRYALAVALDDPAGGRHNAFADLCGVQHLETRADREQLARDLLRPAQGQPEMPPAVGIRLVEPLRRIEGRLTEGVSDRPFAVLWDSNRD